MKLHQQHFINGQWLAEQEQTLFSSLNPNTGEVLWQGPAAGATEIQLAVAAAQSSFNTWTQQTLKTRIDILRQYAEQLQLHKNPLAQAIHQETGKPSWESAGEVASMIGKIDLSIDAYQERTGTSVRQQNQVQQQLTHRAHGVLAVLGPYNFPGHLPNGHIVPAMLAGNTVVFKPSEYTPMVAELMLQCWENTALPKGVINLVQGEAATGATLTQHPQIDGVLFTGSSRTGKSIHKQFGGQPDKIVALEMGGNNPLIVHQAKDTKAAVYWTIQSAFVSSGQRCTCARRLILVRGKASEGFLQQLISTTTKIECGDHDSAFMGPVISNGAAEHLLQAQQRFLEQGAKILLEMTHLKDKLPLLSPGIIDTTAQNNREDEELFGPLLQVIWVDTFEQAISEANNTRFGLAAGLISDNPELWQHFAEQSRAGIVNWNRPLTGASGAAPFGGIGDSGNHRPSAYYAADYCAYPCASLISETNTLPPSLSPGIHL